MISLRDQPLQIDYFAVNSPDVPLPVVDTSVPRQAVATGAGGVAINAAGFAESGPEGVDLPMTTVAVGHQSTDTNNGVVDVLGEFISHCLANLMVGLAVVSIGGGKASEVRDRFNVPNDEMVRHRSSKLMVPKESSRKLAGDAK